MPRASCRGGVDTKLRCNFSEKTASCSKRNCLAENQIQRLLDASNCERLAYEKAAGCRSAVGRVASRSVAPTAQILQKNHSLSMRCQNSDPAPQLLKSAHTRGTQAPSAPHINRGRCRSWGANRNRRLGVFCDGLGMQLDPLCYSLCQIRGSALAVRPRFERDNRTVRFGYADVDCKDVPFLGAHKRPHSLAPIFLKQRQTQNRAGSSHIDPLLKKSS